MVKIKLIALLIFVAACQPANKEAVPPRLEQEREIANNLIAEDSIFSTKEERLFQIESIKSTITEADSLFEYAPDQAKLFFQMNADHWLKGSFDKPWPAKYQYLHSFIFKSDRLIFWSAAPFSLHGRWFNRHAHFFDEAGNLIAFRRESNFYDSKCSEGIAFETSLLFFEKGKLIAKDHWVKNDRGNVIHPDSCLFPYRFDYDIFTSVKQDTIRQLLQNIH